MDSNRLSELHKLHKEKSLFGRYITLQNITPLLDKLMSKCEISVIGYSVNKQPIHSIKIGNGKTKILLWSQMHGNESTTTKALFDILNVLRIKKSAFQDILDACTLQIIPMLNPDGAKAYTRINANSVDLNRDAQDLSQPESRVLRECFDKFQPHFCFNLHGQRTIFGAGESGNPATLSFLSPSADSDRSLTASRKTAMAIISNINKAMQVDLPDAIGRYDDGFNINCVGDTFQSLSVPTILYEAGHYKNDYDREVVRLHIFKAFYYGLVSIASGINSITYDDYFKIPENQKNFFDVIIKNIKHHPNDEDYLDVAIQFKETLIEQNLKFIPVVEKIESLKNYFAHKIIEGNHQVIVNEKKQPLKVANEIDFVMLNNRKILI